MARHILVVDTDAKASSDLRTLFTRAGYESASVESFEAATQRLAREHQDLVITAVRLGKFNGLQIALRCRKLHPNVPVIVLADAADTGLAAEAAQCGARLLPNTIAPEALLKLVAELLGDPVRDTPR